MNKSSPSTREALIKTKIEIDKELGDLRTALKRAAAQYNTTGRGMGRETYFKITTRIDTLKSESQKLQLEIAAAPRTPRAAATGTQLHHEKLAVIFLEVARKDLDPALFHSLLAKAVDIKHATFTDEDITSNAPGRRPNENTGN